MTSIAGILLIAVSLVVWNANQGFTPYFKLFIVCILEIGLGAALFISGAT